MTRPHKSGEGKRDLVIRARFTATEKQKLFLLAAEAGLTPSDFIRSRTIGAAPHIRKATPERAAMIEALGQLGKIGSNVNQIARALNRRQESGELTGLSVAEIDYTLHELKIITGALIKALDDHGH